MILRTRDVTLVARARVNAARGGGARFARKSSTADRGARRAVQIDAGDAQFT